MKNWKKIDDNANDAKTKGDNKNKVTKIFCGWLNVGVGDGNN